jgi:hypothetical protein
VARRVSRYLRRMPAHTQMSFPNFGPILFDIRARHLLTIHLFGIRMPAAASCTGNHVFSLDNDLTIFPSYNKRPRDESKKQGITGTEYTSYAL